MTKIAALLLAILRFGVMIADAIGRAKIKEQRADYEQEIDSIRDDPITHANRLYADNGDPEALSGDYPEDTADTEPR